MGKITEEELKRIIKRASVLQHFHDQSPIKYTPYDEDDYKDLYEIGQSLDINPHFIKEAILEYEGFPVDDPVFMDTNSNYKAELQAQANGNLDGALLNELKAQLEYYFNTMGKLERRKNRVIWKAAPSVPSRFFEINSSPELEIIEKPGRLQFRLRQSLKTYNKFYLPAVAGTLAAFFMFTAAIYGAVGSGDEEPMLIVSAIFGVLSFFYSRFIKGRKLKKKHKLYDLMEIIQQTAERKFRAGSVREKPPVSIPDLDEIEVTDDEDIEISINKKVQS